MRNSKLFKLFFFCSFLLSQSSVQSIYAKKSIVYHKTVTQNKMQSPPVDGLVGKWFIPHSAEINITFFQNGTFIFNDFNYKTLMTEVLNGKFELIGNKLFLKYNDRPKQTFTYRKGKGVDCNYYILKGKNYYFVKTGVDY
jgi:hypothetical protein